MTEITANMPGRFFQFHIKAGEPVKKGDIVAELETMKMRVNVTSPVDGTVKELRVNPGDVVKADTVLMIVE